MPLVILPHGLGEAAGIIRNFTTSGLPDQAGFIIVAPQGSGPVTRWMWDLGDSEYDLSLANPDIAFIDALMDHLGGSLCLDTSRIYAAGSSNGAIGVWALGCTLDGRIAAIAAVAGPTDLGDACLSGPASADAWHPWHGRSLRAVRRGVGPQQRQLHARRFRLVRGSAHHELVGVRAEPA